MTHDPARSYEPIDDADLQRLGRLAGAEVDEFFARNPHRGSWRDQERFVALIQGGAEHYIRGARGIWDLDIAVFFAQHPKDTMRPYLRRAPRRWDWGPSKFGRCRFDDPSYTGRAVDVMLWVIPNTRDPLDGLIAWLQGRRAAKPEPEKAPDLSHEPVVLIAPDRGRVVWDPPDVPAPRLKTDGHPAAARFAPA